MNRSTERDMNRYRIEFLGPELKFLIRRCTTFGIIQIVSCFTYLCAPLLPKSITRLDRPIFIIGCSRSGTTIFVDMLREHRDLAEWSEAGGVFEPRYFAPTINHFKDEGCVTKFHSRRLQVLFGLFTRIRGMPRFLNKHPQNSLRIGFIRAIFPDAKFIHLIRDGYATTYSNYRQVMLNKPRQSIPFGGFPKPQAWKDLLHLPLLLQFGYQWVDVMEVACGSGQDFGILPACQAFGF